MCLRTITALCLILLVVTYTLPYATAYTAAFDEITTFLGSVDFLIVEDKVYHSIFAKVPRREDKVRLSRIHREIQKSRDDLGGYLDRLFYVKGSQVLRIPPRLVWAGYRKQLEKRARRLDRLRTRFLVVYMDVFAMTAEGSTGQPKASNKDKASP